MDTALLAAMALSASAFQLIMRSTERPAASERGLTQLQGQTPL